MASFQLLVFGDQTGSFAPGLQQLLYHKSNSSLVSFFERANLSLRREIAGLPISQRRLFPQFSSIQQLLTKFVEKEWKNPATESLLCCLYQLGCFINYYGSENRAYPLGNSSFTVGLCLGSLAAAAVSSASSLSELLTLGIEAVVVSMRIGLLVSKVGSFIDESPRESSSWSSVVPLTAFKPLSAEAAIAQFQQELGIPQISSPFISARTTHNITISGPPRLQRQLFSSHLVKDTSSINRVPIHAPYHAPHLYSEEDIQNIMQGSTCQGPINSGITMISGSRSVLFDSRSFYERLQAGVEDILLNQLDLMKISQNISNTLESLRPTAWNMIPISTTAAPSLLSGVHSSWKDKCVLSHALMDAVKRPIDGIENVSGRPDYSKIAIVGMSGRFPDAPDLDSFWNILHKGLDVHRTIPPDRFDARLHFDETGQRKNTSKVLNGCWITEPGLFDPKFFNISPKEAAQSDPSQRLALQTAYEALEMAGIVPDRTPSTRRDRVGVFYGMTSDDWREVNSGQNVDTYFIPGGNRAFTPGRLNYYFKFSGPSVSVDTACSSSLAAIHIACNSLWRNDCDTAIAGGTNVMTNPDNFAGLDRGHFLSRTGNCNTFDDAADGYCRADGVGTVILKRLEDAEADNDPIMAVILGAYTNHSAESVSITRPHAGAQEYIFSKLLNESGVRPNEVSYVEMHGTGTQAGDATEMNSVLSTFAPKAGQRDIRESLHLGSAKANVGHAESASGVIALIKTLLMMQKNTIPPHCGIKNTINQGFPKDLTERNVHIAKEPTPWLRSGQKGGKRRAFVNNFSAAGGNSALLIEDSAKPSSLKEDGDDPRSAHVVAISAKSHFALLENLKKLKLFVESSQRDNDLLAKLSYTTTARRMHYSYRTMILASTVEQFTHGLSVAIKDEDYRNVRKNKPGLGFAFSGQGAQYSGMGLHLFKHVSVFRSEILAYDNIAKSFGFPSFLPIFSDDNVEDMDSVLVQLGTTCIQMALATLWQSWGLTPDFVVGHSLGEYAALKVAGVLTASDTIYLVGSRARLLKSTCEAGTHAMLAVKATLSDIRTHLGQENYEVSCINAGNEIVIGGKAAMIEDFAQLLSQKGIKATRINVPYAFHSSQVDPILETLEATASNVTFHPHQIPVISPLLGRLVTTGEHNIFEANYLVRQCREPVNFLGALSNAKGEGLIGEQTNHWIEIGSHTVCSAFLKSTLGPQTLAVPSLRRKDDGWKVLAGSVATLYLSGFVMDWNEYHRDFSACHEVLQLPTYSWENKNYWIQYEHNWTLTKGNKPMMVPAIEEVKKNTETSISTTSTQRVIQETKSGSTVTIVTQSDFADLELAKVAQGHKANGVSLCSSSLYADIGLTIGNYILKKYRKDLSNYGINVANMTIDKPLIVKDEGSMLFRAEVSYDTKLFEAKMSIYSVNLKGTKTLSHAECKLHFEDRKLWTIDWERNSYLIERSINWLEKRADEGINSRIRAGMAYKLFSSLMEYSDDYKAFQEVILDSQEFEGTARVIFQAKKGDFFCNPFWIDSLGQLSGFVMNAHESTPKDQVFVNHGWKSMRCSEEFRADSHYRTYVRMKPIGGTKYSGDVYIIEQSKIVAVFEGNTFQGIPKHVLNAVLRPATTTRTNISQSTGHTSVKSIQSSSQTMVEPKRTHSTSQAKSTGVLLPVQVSTTVPSLLDQILGIISQEIGLVIAELKDDMVFADYGVDSLLSLTITGRIREELNFDIDSSLFTTYETLGDLKKCIHSLNESLSDGTSSSASDSSEKEYSSGITTPDEADFEETNDMETGTLSKVCAILTEEIGITMQELIKTPNFEEIGMDSLLSLTCLGRLREELDIDLESDFFIINPSFSSLRNVFESPKAASNLNVKLKQHFDAHEIVEPHSTAKYKATSTLLQGNPKTARKTFFLFPDGSGSATSYITVNPVAPDVCIYGLNCPWLKEPDQLVTHGLTGLAAIYVTEIRRRAPKGPYSLGGWSAGGICAYEAAIQLTKDGESVENLVLLDSPNPIGLEKLPARFFDFLNDQGVFGEQANSAPSWLLGHFLAFIDALDAYNPIPWQKALGNGSVAPPKTYMIWAEDGVCKDPSCPPPEYREGDPREMRWLLENRRDFGPNGWDVLLDKENMVIETLQNANHFSMLRKGPSAERVAAFLRNVFA